MMDIEMQLVPENASEDDILKLTFAKNDDVEDMTLSSDDDSKRASHMENKCYEFANVPNSDKVLKKLTTVRLKFVKENNSGTLFTVNRISYLMPENLAVNNVGDYKDVKPTESSNHKSGKSFLWNGAKTETTRISAFPVPRLAEFGPTLSRQMKSSITTSPMTWNMMKTVTLSRPW